MLALILNWLMSALVLAVVAYLLPGVHIAGMGTALVASLVLAIINTLIKPILSLLTLPINFLTLGLFSFVINALMFGLGAYLVPGFEVNNFLSALLGSLVLGLLNGLTNNLFQTKDSIA